MSNLSKKIESSNKLNPEKQKKTDKELLNILPTPKKPVKKKSKVLLFWNISNLLLSLIILAILIYYLTDLTNTKNEISKNSNKPAGEFAVSTGVTSTQSINQCTINGVRNSQCSYPANTLNDAINICNVQSDVCDRFFYNEVSKQMTMISLDSPLVPSTQNISVFTRQNGVTYETSGPTSISSSGTGDPQLAAGSVSNDTQSLGSGTFTGNTNNPQNSDTSGATTGSVGLGTTTSGSGY
jgi:hypothetical protein